MNNILCPICKMEVPDHPDFYHCQPDDYVKIPGIKTYILICYYCAEMGRTYDDSPWRSGWELQ